MKKFILITVSTFSISFCSAQMQPADSLRGEYVGLYYYASPPTNPWIIAGDTLFVTNIDSANCLIQANFVIHNVSFGGNYYTNYYSCNGIEPSNYYSKFYSGDSIKRIDDNVPQPPPNPPQSMRFYGKRISNKTAGVSEQLSNEQVKVFPNPCYDVLNIESKMKIKEITIADLLGREMKNEKV